MPNHSKLFSFWWLIVSFFCVWRGSYHFSLRINYLKSCNHVKSGFSFSFTWVKQTSESCQHCVFCWFSSCTLLIQIIYLHQVFNLNFSLQKRKTAMMSTFCFLTFSSGKSHSYSSWSSRESQVLSHQLAHALAPWSSLSPSNITALKVLQSKNWK